MRIKNEFVKSASIFIIATFCLVAVAEESSDSDSDIGLETAEEENQITTIQELKDAISVLMEKKKLPAVGIAMVDETGPVWIGALGKANLENNIAADENSLFRIGSTSKMFVALSVLKLVEEGKLKLGDEVARLVPDVEFENPWADTDPIRIVHLLEHTTGWDDLHLVEYAHNDPTPVTLKEALDYHPHSRVSRWKPGSRSSYCNAGPPVAAYIVEKITGKKFEDYVRENFLLPMGMSTTTYFLNDDVKNKGVTLYDNDGQPQDYWHIFMRPSGSMNASPVDMSKFLQFFLNRGLVNGRQIVSKDSLSRMERVESTSGAKAGQQSGYGLNNYTSPHESWVYREHNGGVNGGITEFAYLPSAKLGHAIMINSGDFAAFNEISKLVRNYETRNLEAPAFSNDAVITDEHRKIEGLYIPINSRQAIGHFISRVAGAEKLKFAGNTLIRQGVLGGEAQKYFPVSTELYRSTKTGMISLSRAIDPIVGEVVHASTRVLQPTSAFVVYGQLAIAFAWALAIASSLLYLLVWGVRKLKKKIPSGATMKIRLWPLFAGLSIIGAVGLFTLGASTPFRSFGAPTPISVGIMLLSIAFALFAVLGLVTAIRERHAEMNRANYWYCSISSGVHFIVALYLMWFGVIGLMSWA